jgi:hypothetical protein
VLFAPRGAGDVDPQLVALTARPRLATSSRTVIE